MLVPHLKNVKLSQFSFQYKNVENWKYLIRTISDKFVFNRSIDFLGRKTYFQTQSNSKFSLGKKQTIKSTFMTQWAVWFRSNLRNDEHLRNDEQSLQIVNESVGYLADDDGPMWKDLMLKKNLRRLRIMRQRSLDELFPIFSW